MTSIASPPLGTFSISGGKGTDSQVCLGYPPVRDFTKHQMWLINPLPSYIPHICIHLGLCTHMHEKCDFRKQGAQLNRGTLMSNPEGGSGWWWSRSEHKIGPVMVSESIHPPCCCRGESDSGRQEFILTQFILTGVFKKHKKLLWPP